MPGGKAAYPSSVLMNALPAQVAGVREIVMVVHTPNGAQSPLVLAAAHVAGVTRAFTVEVGAPRLRGWHPSHWLDPFARMNPVEVDDTGTMTMTRAP